MKKILKIQIGTSSMKPMETCDHSLNLSGRTTMNQATNPVSLDSQLIRDRQGIGFY